MKKTLKILSLLLVLTASTGCLELLFGAGGLIGGNLGSASDNGDDGASDLITLDDNDSSLMQDGPLPIPVTMSKLDPIDTRYLVISSQPYETTQSNTVLRSALADTENEDCVVGEECLVTVRGLAGAVREPDITPFVLLYVDDDQSVFASAAADGSFEAVDLVLTIDETEEKTEFVLIVGITEDNLDTGVSTYPTYFAINDTGAVEYTQTNTDGTITTGVLFIDEFGNMYYVIEDSGSQYDLWRQDDAGGVPLLILENSDETVVDVIAIGEDQVIVFFESGSTQIIAIEDAQARVYPRFVLREALADQRQGRTTTDGKFIADPVEVFDFSDYDYAAAKFFPYRDTGFIVSIQPIPDSEVTMGLLSAYVSLDGSDVRTLVPFDPEDPSAPKKAYIAFTNAFFYILAQFENADVLRTEFSRIPITDDLDATFINAWENREVVFPEMNQEPLDLDADNGTFVFSARNVMNDPEMILWQDGDSELTLLWNFAIQSGIDPLPGLAGGVEVSPNGKFLLACAHVAEAPEGVEQSDDLRALVAKGAHVFAHRIGIDDPGEFHLILDRVAIRSCPDGMQITDDYRLRYFSLETEAVPSQMTFIDLKTLPLFEGLID